MSHCYSVALALLLSISPSLYSFQHVSGASSAMGAPREPGRTADTAQGDRFVRGQLTFPVSRPGTLQWDVGNGSDYLPLRLNVESLSGSTRVSVTVVDQSLAPLKSEGLPPQVLPRYYRIVSSGTIRSLNASLTLSYSDADLKATGVNDEGSLRVYQWVNGRWVQRPVRERNPDENTITVEGIDRLSDVVISGAVGPVFKPATDLISFGSVKAGETTRRTLTIRNAGIDSLGILQARSTSNAFTVEGIEARGDEWSLTLGFHPTEDGMENALLIVEHTAESSPDTVMLTGVGIAPIFSASQGRLDFPKTLVGSFVTDTINVSNYGSDTLVVSATADHLAYRITPVGAVIPPLTSARFAVTFRPESRGDMNARVRFTHNAREKVHEIDLHGIGASPVFLPPAPSVDLGTVYLGESATKIILIRNAGNAQLDISAVSVNGAGFRIEPRSAVISEGDTASFRLSYTAGNVPGNRTATLVFQHNAPSGFDTVRVAVSVAAKPEVAENNTPERFVLRSNYPNPFNPTTTIEFGVPAEAHVTVRVFTMLGVQVRTLANGIYQPGFYSLTWDATNDRGLEVATGMYFYRLEAQPIKEGEKPFVQVRKMLFVK